MANFEDKKSSNDVINNDTVSDDEVASYVPPRYLFHDGRIDDDGLRWLSLREVMRTRGWHDSSKRQYSGDKRVATAT